MAKRGPKMIEIDWEEFDKLCNYQCTLAEIASWFNCSEDTIEIRCKDVWGMKFSEYYKIKSADGRASLRRRMFRIALEDHKSSAIMAIFLSKQHLDYKDKIEDDRFKDLVPLVIETSKGTKKLSLGSKPKKDKK